MRERSSTLNTNDADIFYTFKLARSDVISLVFYFAFLLIYVGIWIVQLFVLNSLSKHFFFFTTHTYMLNMLWLGFSIVNILTKPQKWDCFWQVMRALHVMVATQTLTISLAYWTTLVWTALPNLRNVCSSFGWCVFYTIISHGGVCLPSWIALLAMLTDVRSYDVIWPIGYLLIYIFMVLWPLTANFQVLYSPLTFDNTLTVVFILVWFVSTVIVFFFVYYVSQCTKKRILKSWEGQKSGGR